MLGKPKYKRGDVVSFHTADTGDITGEIWIVDRYGTFEQNEEPSYDVYNADFNILYKHIRESWVFEGPLK